MQGNKKHTDGQSDSSSLGSLLDDTDREVCSLTDRAFKSLCVAELEASYTDSDPIISPNVTHQLSTKFFQVPRNRAIKKSTLSNKLLSKSMEHSTFQQLPKNTQEEKKAVVNITPNTRRKLGLPVPGLRNYKHTSKVSSLIKTFDKAESPESPAIAKQPLKNSLPKCPLIGGGNPASWGSKMILNIQKELSEFSDGGQDVTNASSKHEMHKRHSQMDLVCPGLPSSYPSQVDSLNIPKSNVLKKMVKTRTEKAKEPARRGNFLHSENSAFESWNAHHKKQIEIGGSSEIIPKEDNLTSFKETLYVKESCMPEHKLSPIKGPIILEQDVSLEKTLSQTSLSPVSLSQRPFPPLYTTKDTVEETSLSPVSGLSASSSRIPLPPPLTSKVPFPSTLVPQVVASPPALVSKSPITPPSLPQVSVPPEVVSHSNETQVPLLPEKSKNSEFKPERENVCPPWRRQKANYGGMEMTQNIPTEVLKITDSSHRTLPGATPLAETVESNAHIPSSEASSFNITKLLTPVIVPKQENEPPESQRLLAALPESGGGAKDSEDRLLYCSQNNYKSKAPSLLFNLKDIRKRVKSTYSPSPLLRTLEDKKKIKEQDNIKAGFGAVNLLEESGQKMIENDEIAYKPAEQMDSTPEKESAPNLNGHLTDDYRILSSPLSKEDTLSYQSRHRLWQENSMDFEDCEMVSVTDLHPSEHSTSQHALSYQSFPVDATIEQDVYADTFHLQDPKNKPVATSQNVDMEPQRSPNLFFTVEENMINNENEACPATEKEHKGKTSPSSSEQSFISVVDQPFQEDQFFLMQLFQKACLQESQRSKDEKSEEENPSCKEREQASRQEILHDYGQSNYGSSMDGKCEEKEEHSEKENALQERALKKREGKSRSMDSASEGKLEEPLTPTSSSSFKPNMFKIKDNTFRSAPVIKAVKLPLLRSMSCEAAISSSCMESEKQGYGPLRDTPDIQEMDWSLTRNRHYQNARDAATERDADESGPIPADMVSDKSPECLFREELERFHTHGLVGDDETANIPAVLHRDEKRLVRDKERSRAGKVRPSSACQLSLAFKGEMAQNKQRSPLKEKINYFKNNLLAKGRGGSCAKKIIQTRSPMVLENQTRSPASSDAFGDLSSASGNLTSSIIPSPRSVSMVQSAFTSPLSGTTTTCATTQGEKIIDSSPHHRAAKSGDTSSVMETLETLSGDADSFPVTNERLQLMGQMAKTAAKPPAVPPKTEKALRRAKKLASRRRKTEAQEKKDQNESCCGDMVPLPLGPSPLSPACLNSPSTPLESNLVRLQPSPPESPTHSLPATQRKLLQDPDSGEYFIVELPVQLKTFYDPESGRYIQVSVPPSKRNLSQMPSSEILPPPCALYPTDVPFRVSSVPVLGSPSQFSESVSLMQGSLVESSSDWQQDGRYPEPLDSQPYIDSAMPGVRSREAGGTQYNFEKDMNLSPSADIISMGALEDFACEGVS
ncbi:cardiac-enriched FHL2-interacting protein isoform X1 [Tiliqua scincoides]|uniref:cardiac-enriched FHL2-interacting protein isoform X1 n=1 Tax=Tiliqua scincoides TaxID=71010 RepID=UPI0034626119